MSKFKPVFDWTLKKMEKNYWCISHFLKGCNFQIFSRSDPKNQKSESNEIRVNMESLNNNYILISAPGVFLISDLSSSKDLVFGISAVLPVPLACLSEEFFVT